MNKKNDYEKLTEKEKEARCKSAREKYYRDKPKIKKMRQNAEKRRNEPRFVPRPPKYVIDNDDLLNAYSIEDRRFIMAHKLDHFFKEHAKEDEFLALTRETKDFKNTEEIIVINAGATIERDNSGNWHKNEIISLIGDGYGNKITIVGLKGNGLNAEFDESKQIKKRGWLGLPFTIGREIFDFDESRLIETFITKQSLNLIPFSEKRTVYLNLLDGKKNSTDKEFCAILKARRPNSIVYYLFCKRRTDKPIPKSKCVKKWTSPSPPMFLYRLNLKRDFF